MVLYSSLSSQLPSALQFFLYVNKSINIKHALKANELLTNKRINNFIDM